MVILLWKKPAKNTLILTLTLILGGIFSLVGAQYYYFDAASTVDYPYQQWCTEMLLVKATTDTNTNWATAGLLRLLFDPIHFSYYTWDLANGLQTYLFNASTFTFFDYTNPLMSPIWIAGSNKTILWIDRYKGTAFLGNNLYGTLLFTPVFNPNEYTGTFAIIYNGDTIMTSLSYAWSNIINSSQQNAHLTWYFYVYQQPCVNDTTAPAPTLAIPTAGTKKSYLSGIQLSLTENVGDTNVPYIRTGGLPNVGTWTGNTRGINNQYGVNLSTFNIRISGNGTGRYYSWWMFSPAGTLAAVPSIKTRQFRDKNYAITIDSSKLFDYGIEKPITITGNIRDRNNNISSFSRTINAPFQPWLIVGSDSPSAWATSVSTTAPILLGIADDWAGVNSWSITITLSGINGTAYGPYTFTGTSLNLSWLAGSALQPDYAISISSHVAFPSSWTIQVNVYATDMAGNIDTINDYTFTTRPSCQDLWCCALYIQTGNNTPFLYNKTGLSISGWINPSFTINGNTWTIDCDANSQGMNIYKWAETTSWSSIYVSFFDLPNFVLSWTNVKAILSWHTLYLQKIYVPPITWWCVGSCGWGGGWGWWWWTHLDDCKLPSTLACANDAWTDDSLSYYDNTCCSIETWHGAAPTCDVSESLYTQEITDAFTRGYSLNITNKCPIVEARLDDGIRRKELAKMMTMFTIQVMGIYPDTHKIWCDQFTDVANISDEMKFFTKTSCQLNLMGLEPNGSTPKKVFDPNDFVDRAQFGTILSRLIYGDVYNVYSGEETTYKWYEKHLRALYEDNIMNKIQDPFMLEKRARILLMLKRTNDDNLIEKYRLLAPAHNWALSLLENIW